MQATWGIFDKDNILRRALFDSLQSSPLFYTRWKEYEMAYHQAASLHFTLEQHQWDQDWKNLIALAGTKGGSLEQIHIFVLCHIFRRPIIVYSVKQIKVIFHQKTICFDWFVATSQSKGVNKC